MLAEKASIQTFIESCLPAVTFTAAVNNSAGYDSGITSIVIDSLTTEEIPVTDAIFTIAGETPETQHTVVDYSEITGIMNFSTATVSSISDDAVITFTRPATFLIKRVPDFTPPAWQLTIPGEDAISPGLGYFVMQLNYYRDDGDENKAIRETEQFLKNCGFLDAVSGLQKTKEIRVICKDYPNNPNTFKKFLILSLFQDKRWQNLGNVEGDNDNEINFFLTLLAEFNN